MRIRNLAVITLAALIPVLVVLVRWEGREHAKSEGNRSGLTPRPAPAPTAIPSPPATDSVAHGEPTRPSTVMGNEHLSFFSADANGGLVLSETTLQNLEKLHALNEPEAYLAKLRQLSSVLPPRAHAELLALASRYIEYIDALQTSFPPEAEIQTVGEAEAELKGIHELRVKHFGAEAAEALYGKEEKLSRQMIELMALEADASLPLAEKAHRAQQLLQPGIGSPPNEVPAPTQPPER